MNKFSDFMGVFGLGPLNAKERAQRVHVVGFAASLALSVMVAMIVIGYEPSKKGFAQACDSDAFCAEHYCRDINGNPVAGCEATCFGPTKQCNMAGAAGLGTEVRIGGSMRSDHAYKWTIGVLAFFGGLNLIHGLVAASNHDGRDASFLSMWAHFLGPMVPGIVMVLGIVYLVLYGMKMHQSMRCATSNCRDREGRKLENCDAQPQTSSDGKEKFCTVDSTGVVIGWELRNRDVFFGVGLGLALLGVVGYSAYWLYILNVLGVGALTRRVTGFANGKPSARVSSYSGVDGGAALRAAVDTL